jgi:ligand-binding sensor domain-containing protein
MRLLISIVFPLLSLSVLAQSERYNFSKLDTYTGLSHNQVNAILKDPTGFIRFGTTSGLNRYDGSTHNGGDIKLTVASPGLPEPALNIKTLRH